MHNSTHHNAEECREIKKITEQYREQLKQQRGNGGACCLRVYLLFALRT
jgi:hypothetical protein